MTLSDEVNPIVFISLNRIVLAERQRVPERSAIDRVAMSMADTGLLHPIGVTPSRVLIFGATRLAAARQLGWESIEAREFDSAEDPQVRALMEWEENDARRDLTLEEQMAYKRKVVDPILKARAQARKVTAGTENLAKSGYLPSGGNFPPLEESRDLDEPGPSLGDETGKARDLVSKYIDVSGRTMEKFEQLVDWSDDESLPEGLRVAASEARERANVLGKVDGEYKRVRALKEKLEAPEQSSQERDAIVEQRFVRGYSMFEELLEHHPPVAVGQVLTPGSLKGFRFVVDRAKTWLGEAEDARRG